jgi:hypothetical protein
MLPRLESFMKHLLDVSFFDNSIDLRDKARLLSSIFAEGSLCAAKTVRLLDGDTPPLTVAHQSPFIPCCLSYLIGDQVAGYSKLWGDMNNLEALRATLMSDTASLRTAEEAPVLHLPPATHYSSQDTPQIADSGLRTRIQVRDPQGLEDFLGSSESDESD